MAALTWRSVAAPDFSGVQGGISNAGEFFNRAFSGGQKTVENIQNIREDNAVREVLGRALASNDPAAIQAMAAEAAQNPNFTMRGLDSLNRQVDTIQQRQVRQQAMDIAAHQAARGEILEDRADADYNARITARGGMNRMLLSGQLDPNDPSLAALPSEDVAGLVNDITRNRQAGTQATLDGQRVTQGQLAIDAIYDQREGDAYLQNSRFGAQTLEEQQAAFLRDRGSMRPGVADYLAGKLGLNAPLASGGPNAAYAASVTGPNSNISYDQFRLGLESSGGNPNARNPESSATGRDQFTNGTWLKYVEKERPQWAAGKSKEEILNMRTNPTYSAQMEQALRRDNTQMLQNAGLPVNNENLYALHHFSPEVAMRFIKAPDNAAAGALFPQAVLASNKYLQGKTKGQIINNWYSRVGGKPPESAQAIQTQLGQIDPVGLSSAMASLQGSVNRAAAQSPETTRVVNEFANSKMSATDALGKLKKSLVDTKGWDLPMVGDRFARNITDAIVRVKGMAKGVTNEMAVAFIENAITPGIGGGVNINFDGIQSAINRYASGDTDRDLGVIAKRNAGMATVQRAYEGYQAADQQYIAAQALVNQGLADPSILAQRGREKLQTYKVWEASLKGLNNSSVVDKGVKQPAAKPKAPATPPKTPTPPPAQRRAPPSPARQVLINEARRALGG